MTKANNTGNQLITRCVLCGSVDVNDCQKHLLAFGVECSQNEGSSATQKITWIKESAYIWKATLCKGCIPKAFEQKAKVDKTASVVPAKMVGLSLCILVPCAAIIAPRFYDKMDDLLRIASFIGAIAFLYGFLGLVIFLFGILPEMVLMRINARRFHKRNLIKPGTLVILTKTMAENILNREGVASLISLMGDAHSIQDMTSNVNKREYRGKIIAVAATPTLLQKVVPEEWKSWVKRRLDMRALEYIN